MGRGMRKGMWGGMCFGEGHAEGHVEEHAMGHGPTTAASLSTLEQGHIWCTVVPTASPTLLGLDYIEAAGADFSPQGFLRFPDGHHEPLTRLPSGHWGLPLI